MLKIVAAALLAASIYAGPASAAGGSPAEPMPETNFTDMPAYQPKPVKPVARSRGTRNYLRWHHGGSRDD